MVMRSGRGGLGHQKLAASLAGVASLVGWYVVGNTDGEFPGQTGEGDQDAFIRKYNSDGDEEWTRQFWDIRS